MAPDGSWKNRSLPNRGHYLGQPELKDDEELVEFRKSNNQGKIWVKPGEIVLGIDGQRFPYENPHVVEEGLFKGSGGRYIIRKKGSPMQLEKKKGYHHQPTLKSDEVLVEYREPIDGRIPLNEGEFVIMDNGQRSYSKQKGYFSAQTGRYVIKKKIYTNSAGSHQPNQEVVMAEQKPLSYKRETLIEALNSAVTENEKKRAEDKQKKLDKDKKAVDQVIEAMKTNPRFAGQMLCQAAALAGANIRTSEDVGTEAFKKSVQENYPDLDDVEIDPDSDLKKLIRVYEKAEDETVEVHVHDTVYNYL